MSNSDENKIMADIGLTQEAINSLIEIKDGKNGKVNMIVFNELLKLGLIDDFIESITQCILHGYPATVATFGMSVFESAYNDRYINATDSERVRLKIGLEINKKVKGFFDKDMNDFYLDVMKHFHNPENFKNGKMLFGEAFDKLDIDLQAYFLRVILEQE